MLTPTLSVRGSTHARSRRHHRFDGVVDLGALVAGERLVGDPLRRARCARTPRGRRAVAKRQRDVQAAALPAVPGPEPLHLVGVDRSGSRAGTTPPNVLRERVVVDDERGAAAAHHAVELAQAGLAAGSEEVRPPRLHDVDATRAGAAPAAPYRASTVTFASRRGTTGGQPRPGPGAARRRPPCARLGRPARQVEAGAAAEVEHVAPGPAGAETSRIAASITPVGVDGAVLELVGLGVVPDVRARDRAASGPARRTGLRCGRGRSGCRTARRRRPGCRAGRPSRPRRPRAGPRRSCPASR